MSVLHHESILETLFEEEMEAMLSSGIADLLTPEALQEHCEYIAKEKFEDQLIWSLSWRSSRVLPIDVSPHSNIHSLIIMPDDSNYTQLQIENLIEENNIDEDLNEYFGDEDQELEAYSLECVYGADDYNDSDWDW